MNHIRKNPLKSDSIAKQKKMKKIKCLIEILYSTGLRVSELINLKIGDIDLSKRTLVVFGKGGKERNAYFQFSKVQCSLSEHELPHFLLHWYAKR